MPAAIAVGDACSVNDPVGTMVMPYIFQTLVFAV